MREQDSHEVGGQYRRVQEPSTKKDVRVQSNLSFESADSRLMRHDYGIVQVALDFVRFTHFRVVQRGPWFGLNGRIHRRASLLTLCKLTREPAAMA